MSPTLITSELWRTILAIAATPTRLCAEETGSDPSWVDQLQSMLRESIGPPLKSLHAPVDAWLGSLPMSVAVACAVGLYVVATIWVWTLRRDFVFRGAPDKRWWRDLRIWATIVVLPYVTVYLILGR